jgi:hypothetical protein
MDPRDFLDLAGRLNSMSDAGPAHHRAAIGRAYYAAYCVAAEVFDRLRWPLPRSANGHDQVVRLLQSSGDAELRTAGGLLSDLRTDRNRADYDMSRTDVEKPKVAMAKVETAKLIVSELDKFLTDQSRKEKAATKMETTYKIITGKSKA